MNKAITLAAVATVFLASCTTQQPDSPPELAGQPVPNENIVIDFTKRFNLVCRDGESSRTYTSCRILGYTGDTVRDPEGIYSKRFGQFGRWLAVQLPGGRRVFLSPSSISFLEETAG